MCQVNFYGSASPTMDLIMVNLFTLYGGSGLLRSFVYLTGVGFSYIFGFDLLDLYSDTTTAINVD